MNRNNEIKSEQLGMPHGTAANILRKNILFTLLRKHKENICFQCGQEIETVDDLSIEHKIPYLHSNNPVELYFSMDNIAFSHLKCNIRSIRPANKGNVTEHGTRNRYVRHGCRCDECKKAQRDYERLRRSK